MSSEQSSVNPETVEQTKQQIRGLVSEIAQLSKSDLGSEEYYAAFLQRIVSALAAVGGAVWALGQARRPLLAYQINLSATLLQTDSEDAQRHVKLLHHVISQREPLLVPPLSGASDEEAGGNPTRYLLVLAPLISDGQVEGVVEIFQRANAQPATQRGYLRFLVQMCELAGEWLKSRKLKQFSDRHSLWAQADHFSRLVHDTLDLRETAYTITNEGRRLIGCDRVSVAIRRGRTCKVEAISGQDTIENRSNVVAALGNLASKVVATGEPLWYEGSTEDLPPQIERSLEAYIDESYSKTLTVLPIRKPKTADTRAREVERHEASSEHNLANVVVGALIVEQIETDLPREILEPRIDLVYEHSARSLSNSLDHNNLFLMPVWRTLGKASWVVQARNLPKTLTVAAVVLIILLGLFVFPADFEPKAKGSLQPVDKRDVFVNEGGMVKKVHVEDQQFVKRDDKLIGLSNPELLVQLQEVEGEMNATRKRLLAASDALLHGIGLSDEEKVRLAGQVMELKASLTSLEAQAELLLEKERSLVIRSPIDGIVMLSWDVEKSLLGRRVEPGQVLMSVANPEGPWELELFMPERRIGHVNAARRTEKLGPKLSVHYILATDPATTYEGSVKYVDKVTRMHGDEGHTVRIRVDIDAPEHTPPPNPRPGATVTGGVYCGRRPLGYTWFHEAIEWVQANLLF